ncbi:MAG: hypothetical protein ACYC6C_05575 [Coriobacteriia bacterium]
MVVNIDGLPETAITGIDYDDTQVIDGIKGAGQVDVARGYGNIDCKASMSLLRSVVEAMRAASDTRRLQDIAPFDIIVAFIPMNGTTLITHKIRNCQFKNDAVGIKQGDTKNEVTLEMICSHIEW